MRVFAPAKINLGLSVLGRRADGYHELHGLMLPLSVGDELEVERAGNLSLVVRGSDLPGDEDNLVYRAARAYLDAAGVWDGARIVLHKRLPVASGLGGGSSDAASTLLALEQLYPAGVDLFALARALGADVPFFLLGGPALAEGVGERLTPLRLLALDLVLANPGVAVSARDAYAWLDGDGAFTPKLNVAGVLAALPGTGDLPYFNALQAPVAARVPEIARTLDALREAGLRAPLMSGSGATCFALAETLEEAERAAEQLAAAHPHWWVCAARSMAGTA